MNKRLWIVVGLSGLCIIFLTNVLINVFIGQDQKAYKSSQIQKNRSIKEKPSREKQARGKFNLKRSNPADYGIVLREIP